MEKVFKTPFQKLKEQKEVAIYSEYSELVSVPGRSKVEIAKFLCDKYGLATISTVYAIRKRVEKRLKQQCNEASTN